MYQIMQTKKTNTTEKDVDKPFLKGPNDRPKKDDPEQTITIQQEYPLLKPIRFTNEIEDDFLESGVWHLKK